MGDGYVFFGSKEKISAWDGKKRFSEGLRIDEVIIVIDCPTKGKMFKGKVKECWKDKEGNQLFILDSEGFSKGILTRSFFLFLL